MKPSLKTETKENVMMDTKDTKIRKALPKRWVFAGILGLLVIVLIAVATVLGIYIGKSMTKEAYKEAWVTYHDTYTDTVMKERYIVQDQEVYITKPGEVGIIYDYGRNQVVMNVNGMKVDGGDGGDDCLCMVFDFDKTNEMSLDELVTYLNQTYIYQSGNFTTERMVLEQTGADIDILNLSRKSKEMCLGCKISEMNVRKGTDLDFDNTIQKRATEVYLVAVRCSCGKVTYYLVVVENK